MAAIQTLHVAPGLLLRSLVVDGRPWFVAKDVCNAFGTVTRDIRSHLLRAGFGDHEIRSYVLPGQRGRPSLLMSEPALYAIILKSPKPEAQAFLRQVATDVLPTIRKFGLYVADKRADAPWSGCCDAKSQAAAGEKPAKVPDRNLVVYGNSRHLLSQNSYRDSLTGLVNRQGLEAIWQLESPTPRPYRLGFLAVNFQQPLPPSDASASEPTNGVLRIIATRLQSTVREGDLVCRLDAHEFGILMAVPHGFTQLKNISQRIVDVLARSMEVGGQTLQIKPTVDGLYLA